MTRIPLTFDLIESDSRIAELILAELAKEFNRKVPRHIDIIRQRIKNATYLFLQSTATYKSLVAGDLAAHFGIPIAGRQQRINNIIKAISDRMEVRYHPVGVVGRNFSSFISIGVVLTNLTEVLTLNEGRVITEKGQILDWLNWLLTRGDTIIISKYEVELRPGHGRSGGGLMILDYAGAWRVPPEFSGTIHDNWFTRAFNNNIKTYLSIIESIIKNELSRI